MKQALYTVPQGTKKPNKNVIKIFRALGTVNSIYISECADKTAVDLAAERVLEIDDRMSMFKSDSDVALINSSPGSMVRVHEDTIELLRKSLAFSNLSKGAFDITAAPLTGLWKEAIRNEKMPDLSEIKKFKKLTGYEDLTIDERNCGVMLRRKGQKIDLGGIAKGYAADEVKRILSEHEIRNAMINLGGNIIALGTSPSRDDWAIGIQDPFKRTGVFLGTLTLTDETAVTSGSNEQYFIKNGLRYHHIIDPRTGIPADTDILSVTVVGECSADMDGLSTAVFVMGVEKGMELVNKYKAQAIFVGADGSVYITEKLKNRFRFTNDKNCCGVDGL